MKYHEVIDYLYSATPQFQLIGAAAYKPGLDTVRRLSVMNGNSHASYPIVHIAGTNGKGSTAHTLAAILQSAGYRTGLFTSPHLLDFRERIRIDGCMVTEEDVCNWVERYLSHKPSDLNPSFFELTTVMAFDLFAKHKVDIAVVEVGLGGRLDSTNIVDPVLSVISNVSKDHVAQLGNTLAAIAAEKAGVIKAGVPVVLGESDVDEVFEVIRMKADEMKAPLFLADKPLPYGCVDKSKDETFIIYKDTVFGDIAGELTGDYQQRNGATVLKAVEVLMQLGFDISSEAVKRGFSSITKLTGLAGRWMKISEYPTVICDTGHNEGGWRYLSNALNAVDGPLAMVIGFVNDKDVDSILSLMPRHACYYFTNASVPRAMPAEQLAHRASAVGLKGSAYPTVALAVAQAQKDLKGSNGGLVFVGGSTFVVADALAATANPERS